MPPPPPPCNPLPASPLPAPAVNKKPAVVTGFDEDDDAAFEAANPPGDADPTLDLQGLPSPLWGHHSLRRFADTCARQTMAQTGATEQDIDLTFGWQESMYSARMQIHYESKFDREKRKAVTRMV